MATMMGTEHRSSEDTELWYKRILRRAQNSRDEKCYGKHAVANMHVCSNATG